MTTERLYLLQDSRSTCGTNMEFWGPEGRGYLTDVEKAGRYPESEAFAQHRCRPTDIPIPEDYVMARTRRVVDMQHVSAEGAKGIVDTHYYLQRMPQDWDGNDIYFVAAAGGRTTELPKAKLVTASELAAFTGHVAWPKSYIDSKSRLTVSVKVVDVAAALEETGLKLTPIPKERKEQYRCHGCGIFLSVASYYGPGCPRCGADNRP